MRMLMIGVLAGLTLSACGGPKVSPRMQDEVSAEARAQAAPIRDTLEQLEDAREAVDRDITRAKGEVETRRLQLDAAQAQLAADEAVRKAARQEGDTAAVRRAEDAAAESRKEIDGARRSLEQARARVEVLEAQREVVRAEQDLREAELQLVFARDLEDDAGLDVNRFADEVAIEKRDFEESRQQLAQARLAYGALDPEQAGAD